MHKTNSSACSLWVCASASHGFRANDWHLWTLDIFMSLACMCVCVCVSWLLCWNFVLVVCQWLNLIFYTIALCLFLLLLSFCFAAVTDFCLGLLVGEPVVGILHAFERLWSLQRKWNVQRCMGEWTENYKASCCQLCRAQVASNFVCLGLILQASPN